MENQYTLSRLSNLRPPLSKTKRVCAFTPEGRKGLHDNLGIDTSLLSRLMRNPSQGQSVEFNDNKLSLFSAQWGRCGVTQRKFANLIEIHCHHKIPKEKEETGKVSSRKGLYVKRSRRYQTPKGV